MSVPQAERHYTGAAGRQYHEAKRGIPESAFPWIARLRASKIAPYVHNSDVVFEFGVGTGWNLAELNCRRRIGCDIAGFLEQPVRARGIEFVRDAKWMDNFSVDVALCHHTLEHVINPPAVLQELRRMLCVNGKLLLYVPLEKEAKYNRFDANEPNHHLYAWNVQTLGNLVTEAGFKVVEAGVGEFGYDRFASVWAQRLHIGESGFRLLRRLIQIVKPMREVRMVAIKPEPAAEPQVQPRRERPPGMNRPQGDNRPPGQNRDRRGGRPPFRSGNRGGGRGPRDGNRDGNRSESAPTPVQPLPPRREHR